MIKIKKSLTQISKRLVDKSGIQKTRENEGKRTRFKIKQSPEPVFSYPQTYPQAVKLPPPSIEK